jgi:hypothetical protein
MPEKRRRRWPYFPVQRALVFTAAGIFLGAALPWAIVLGKAFWPAPLALSWTLWAGLMTLASAVLPWRPVVLVSALGGGGTAVGFALWQAARIFDRCALSFDCAPGPGLGVLLVSSGATLFQAVQLVRERTSAGRS